MQKGRNAAHKESNQTHSRMLSKPVGTNSLTPEERKKSMENLIILTKKRDGCMKGKTCANGRAQRSHASKNKADSPKAAVQSVLLTAAMKAKEESGVMTLDKPSTILQTSFPEDESVQKRFTMK